MAFFDNSRRSFMKTAAAAATALGIRPVSHSVSADDGISKVAIITNDAAVDERNNCNRDEARKMIDRGLAELTGESNPEQAWRNLGFSESDTVAIKVNCNTWTFLLHTHPNLVYELCQSLGAIVPANNMIIYERDSYELSRSGYSVNKSATGIRCYGTGEGGGFDSDEELTKIITDEATKVINMPSLKTVEGEFAGSLFLKNHIGSIPRSKMPKCHGNADYCAEVCARPNLKDKTVLAVCDGLRGTYKRGTPWYAKSIIMSTDQVAAEMAALDIINEKRTLENMGALDIPPYVKNTAPSLGLGVSDPTKIDMSRITV